jgi:hypothetical protein
LFMTILDRVNAPIVAASPCRALFRREHRLFTFASTASSAATLPWMSAMTAKGMLFGG